jgi:[acyl-carrier-protein] S-malonyltransferase
MGRIGLVFPGQGSQFVGMGVDLCGSHHIFRGVFERAGEILDTDILSLCLNGPREALDQTVNTQLAVLTFEIAAFETLKELNALDPAVIAGHSLGEYSAIYASGALGLEEILTLVRSRAKRHEEAVPQGFGAMAAVVGLTLDQMKELVMECSREDEPVDLANINAPIQTVVSGHARAVERLMERAKETGAKLVVRLPISAPCHCRLLAEASGLFQKDLEKAHFGSFEHPVIPNCEPSAFYSRENAAEFLRKQIISPVRWQETVEKMAEMGVETIVEVGPKRVLSGLIRNIRKDMRLIFVGDAESLGKCSELVRAA